jgi:phosphate transport system protein
MMLSEKMSKLREKIVLDATRVEKMIEKSVRGLFDRDPVLLKEVIEVDELAVNQLEIEIDQMCTDLIALHQPEAKDLRTVLMALKMNSDLERMGDQAVNICQHGLAILESGEKVSQMDDFIRMSAETKGMIHDAITGFINEDVRLSREVCSRDNKVDDLRDKIGEALYQEMSSDSGLIKRSLHLLRIASELERIADLSTNICEDTIFMTAGQVIKHHHQ